MTFRATGIFRETLHSPDRESDDFEILRLTGAELSSSGVEVSLAEPEKFLAELQDGGETAPDLIFVMCEQEKILGALQKLSLKGAVVVNSPESVLSTYRHRMLPIVQSNGTSFPRSVLLSTQSSASAARRFLGDPFEKVWVKRGDVHNTQKGDVTLARSFEEVRSLLDSFAARGISQAVLQEDVPGDLIKFYGVGFHLAGPSDEPWFKWFYHKNQDLKKYHFSESGLRKLTQTAAENLGLEIFGGDAVVTPEGKIFLIDINAWPSFALFRQEASRAIAHYLHSKLKRRAQVLK